MSAYLIGEQSLLIQCGEAAMARGHEVRGVVTGDADIAEWAEGRGLRVVAPGPNLAARLSEDGPFDWLLSIANLTVVPDDVLALPREGAINFHDGPLPEYAGLRCTSWAILRGERTHAVTWHRMLPGVDEGEVLVERRFEVGPRETALTLNTRCYELGMETFGELLGQLEEGRLDPRTQDLTRRSYFGREDRPEAASSLDFTRPARELDALVRALDFGPYDNPLGVPKAWWDGEPFWVDRAEPADDSVRAAPGTIVHTGEDGMEVACGEGTLRILRLRIVDGTELPLPDAASRYGMSPGGRFDVLDGAHRARLSELDRRAAREEPFWRRRLRRAHTVSLPYVDHAGTPGTVHALPVTLPPGHSAGDLAALVGVWAARLAGEPHATLGFRSARATREVRGAEPLFAPLAPLHVEVPPEAAREKAGAAAREELDRLASHLPPLRDLPARHPGLRAPAFDVALEIVDAGRAAPADWERPAAPVTLRLDADGAASLRADAGRLSPDAAARMAEQIQTMAEASALGPARPMARLPLIRGGERDCVLGSWNATRVEPPGARLVHRCFQAQVARTPDAPALVFGETVRSYAEVDAAANRLAQHLRSLGVGPGRLVGLCMRRSHRMVEAALAVWKAGGAYVPLDPDYPSDRLRFMLEDSEARVLVSESSLAERLGPPPAEITIVRLDADAPAIAAREAAPVDGGAAPEDLAYVIYTSGSTGRPKGVMVEHRNVTNFFAGMDAWIPRRGDGTDTWLAVTSLSFDISVLELFWTLARGFRVVIAPEQHRAVAAARSGTGRPVGFSLFYFASDEGESDSDKYRLLMDGARFADRHGFEAVWTPERHFHAFGGLYPNPSVASAAIAAVTERVAIRAGSCVLPLHHPLRVAEEWALVDNLSNGRVGISFASGWQPNDFVLRPESFGDPKGTMLRDLDVVRRLWRGEELELDGPKGPVRVRTLPRPVQRELPFWLTAAGNPATFEAAGRAGAGLLTHLLGQSVKELGAKIERYRQARREAGHLGDGHVTLMLHAFVGEDEDEVKERVRGPLERYLASSMSLIREHAWSFPAFRRQAREGASFEDDFQRLSPEDAEALIEHAFERYYENSGLFGTPDRALRMVEACRSIGVDEIACLIDFGVDSDTVLAHLPMLAELRARAEADVGRAPSPATEEPVEVEASIPALIERHGVTHLQCTPSMARMLVTGEGRGALRAVEHLLVGGEPLQGGLAAELTAATDARVLNMYGPTETTIWSTVHPAGPAEGTVPIGRPIANTRVYVLDAHGEPLPVGVPGELHIAGEGVTRGYLGREALTRERFVPDPFAADGSRMYRTGDRVRWRDDGVLEFLGRTDHQVKVRGHRVELGEIEACLASHPGVGEVVVAVHEVAPEDARLVAYHVPGSGEPPSPEVLREHLARELPPIMVPSAFVTLERWPLTPNGKIDRTALPPPHEGAAADRPYVAPEPGLEQTLAAIWCRLLGVPRVGGDDNFFDLGGHSLLAVQAHREIRETLGREITVTDLFRFPTIRALAGHLEGGEQGLEAPAERGAARRAARRRAAARRGRAAGG
ncbi:MAG: MupA/Atu3671 family FMN-dependent luciferase-like monooxygenase [Myxococcota bacterium]